MGETAEDCHLALMPTEAIWAMDAIRMGTFRKTIAGPGVADAIRGLRSRRFRLPMAHDGGVAVIEISGVMSRDYSWYSDTSTSLVQAAVEDATADKDTHTILLRLDSPGGSVDGLAELGDALFAARQVKKVVAQGVGIMASAAYYAASQAHEIYAQRMDLVGSIGTVLLLYDWSELFAEAGVEAVPIDTGEFKSAGAMGTKITDKHREYFQSIVDGYFNDFVSAIARGRALSDSAIRALADGRVMHAADAAAAGLIDGIQTFEQTLADLKAAGTTNLGPHGAAANTRKEIGMNGSGNDAASAEPVGETITQPQAAAGQTPPSPPLARGGAEATATPAELRAAFPDATADWREGQAVNGATMAQATAARSTELEVENKRLRDEAAAAKTPAPGVDALTDVPGKGATAGGDAKAELDSLVKEKVAAGMSKHEAHAAVCRENDELRQRVVAQHNAEHPGR